MGVKKGKINTIKESEEWFRSVFDGSRDAVFIANQNSKFVDVNLAASLLTGYTREELLKMSIPDLHEEEDLTAYKAYFLRIMSGIQLTSEAKILRKDKNKIDVEFSNKRIVINNIPYMHTVARDITERRKAQENLRELKESYETLINTSPDAVTVTNLEGKITFVSNQTLLLHQAIHLDQILGKNALDFIDPKDHKKAKSNLDKTMKEGNVRDIEYRMRRLDGTSFIGELNASLIRDAFGEPKAFIASCHDITDRKKAEIQLKDSLKEKEVLLKEIHHRVKGNLQIICSLLSLQGNTIANEEVLAIFQECKNRIKTIALIHENLYQSDQLSNIDFRKYINKLVLSLFDTFNINRSHIKLKLDIENIFLEISNALPSALIINELVSNSLKYAFPDKRKGELQITFFKENSEYKFCVKDNGVGCPEKFNLKKVTTFGLQLVPNLVDQLKGQLNFLNKDGVQCHITFPMN